MLWDTSSFEAWCERSLGGVQPSRWGYTRAAPRVAGSARCGPLLYVQLEAGGFWVQEDVCGRRETGIWKVWRCRPVLENTRVWVKTLRASGQGACSEGATLLGATCLLFQVTSLCLREVPLRRVLEVWLLGSPGTRSGLQNLLPGESGVLDQALLRLCLLWLAADHYFLVQGEQALLFSVQSHSRNVRKPHVKVPEKTERLYKLMWIICLQILPPIGFLCDSGCNDTVLSCLCVNVLNLLFHFSDSFHLMSLSNTLFFFFFFGFTISFPKPTGGIFTEFSHLCGLGLLGCGSWVPSAGGLNSTCLFLTSLEAESPRTRFPQTCVWWRSFLILSVSSRGGRGCGL